MNNNIYRGVEDKPTYHNFTDSLEPQLHQQNNGQNNKNHHLLNVNAKNNGPSLNRMPSYNEVDYQLEEANESDP